HVQIAISRRNTQRGQGVDARPLLLGQPHRRGPRILLKAGTALGAGDRHYVVTLRQQPRQGQLSRRHALLRRDRLDRLDETQVAVEVLARKTGVGAPPVVGRQVGEARDLPGEEAPSNGLYGTMPTPSSLAAGRISASMSLVHSDHSVSSAEIGWTAFALRKVPASTSDRPR